MVFSTALRSRFLVAQSKPAYKISTILAAILLCSACSNHAADAKEGNTDIVTEAKTMATDTTKTPVDSANAADVVSALQANLKASGINETITSAVPTDMPGIYWVTAEGLPAFFADKSGKYIIQGQIVQVGDKTPVDISAALVAKSAKEKLAAVDKKDMVIFPATGETKAVIYVFTDADCGYCQKLHSEIKQTNDLGIEVRYLAWPRSEASVPKMEAIWCSKDRQAAMNQAKAGANVSAASCPNPVRKQLELGMALGVSGTPAVFTEDGRQLGGYLPSAQLAQALGIR